MINGWKVQILLIRTPVPVFYKPSNHCFTLICSNTDEKTGTFIYSSTFLHRNSFLINGIANLLTNEFSKICDIITGTGLF